MFDIDRKIVWCRFEFLTINLVIIQVQLQQGGYGFVIQVNAVIGKTNLFGEIITALVPTIQIQINRNNVIGCHGSYQTRRFHTEGIGQH